MTPTPPLVLSEAVLVIVLVIEVPGITTTRKIDYDYDYEHEHESTPLPAAGEVLHRAAAAGPLADRLHSGTKELCNTVT